MNTTEAMLFLVYFFRRQRMLICPVTCNVLTLITLACICQIFHCKFTVSLFATSKYFVEWYFEAALILFLFSNFNVLVLTSILMILSEIVIIMIVIKWWFSNFTFGIKISFTSYLKWTEELSFFCCFVE